MQQSKILIIDYGMGNLQSVQKKFAKIGCSSIISGDLDEIKKAEKLILPGVGNFSTGIRNLKKSGILPLLNEIVLAQKKPILGICLGMQLMGRYSEEGHAEGFGWIDADIIKFNVNNSLKFKIPHMGWNNLDILKPSAFLSGVTNKSMFYFVHSYHMQCDDLNLALAKTVYEYSFISVIQKDNIYGVQFHPEKSHRWGEIILKNFADIHVN